MTELLKSDGTVGKCARCNRKIVSGERYTEKHGVLFGASCLPHVAKVEHLFSSSEDVVALVQQHRLLTSQQTKDGLARRKARLVEQTVSVQDLLALGM
jgi:hypothetical protein